MVARGRERERERNRAERNETKSECEVRRNCVSVFGVLGVTNGVALVSLQTELRKLRGALCSVLCCLRPAFSR